MSPRRRSFAGVEPGRERGPVSWRRLCRLLIGVLLPIGEVAAQQVAGGSIRGVVHDADFDAPLAAVQVLAVEIGRRVETTDQGQYVMPEIPPGRYTLVFTKDGYVRRVEADVVVVSGQLTDVDAALAGEFTEMDEFVVQDVLGFAAGSEIALLTLRSDSAAMLDSIGADMMSRAGASDAASALKLVAGASVQDGKYAVVRGLPDRYVSSQINGVRVPSADEDKRAVELDQFPAAILESIQVSKTFTPDQQGDASGGAVDVRLKGIPDETILQFRAQTSFNSQVAGRSDFLTYEGGGVGTWGRDDGDRDQQLDALGGNWTGAAGTTTEDAPIDSKWSLAAGGKIDVSDDWKLGGFASFFYERDSSYHDNGVDDSYWVTDPGAPMTPETTQGTPTDGDFKTALFDITKSRRSVQWGGVGTIGLESEDHAFSLTYLYTHTAEDTATLAIDQRGKEYYFPGYTVRDPSAPGNESSTVAAAPWLRNETLDYTERTTGSLQFRGRHRVPMGEFDVGAFHFLEPQLEWTVAKSFADSYQPDKRQFGALWHPDSLNTTFGILTPATWLPYFPAATFSLGNFQRIWKSIDEDSLQSNFALKLPFEQWDDHPGSLKFGIFADSVDRSFDQDTFSNFGDAGASYQGGWNDPWSSHFDDEDHPITASDIDVDYRGEMDVAAWYGMIDLPITSVVDVTAGARFESTRIGIVNDPEDDAVWYPPGSVAPVDLNPGDADVEFSQDDALPAVALTYRPVEELSFRASYSETIARQTFKELTPIQQQEYLGGPVFIGNPDLRMSALRNYDLRADYVPYEGSLVSLSWFDKDVDDPIEYVQQPGDFTYTTPVNYPEGTLSGVELEARQSLGQFWETLDGFSVGANGTLISSEVTLPDDQIADFAGPEILAPITSRDMTNAPEYLINAYVTYDIESTGTQIAFFYTVQGDTLVAGAGEADGNFVPNVYARTYDTLNLSLSQRLGEYFKLSLALKNLTNPHIEEVYRSEYSGDDVTKTSYTRGVEFSIALGASFSF